MAALVLACTVVGGLATLGSETVAWYEAAAPCLVAGLIFIVHAHWAVKKVAADSRAALAVTMSGIGIHFGVVVVGGLGLILGADFHPAAVLFSLLAAFAVCQPLSTLAIRRAILEPEAASAAGGASNSSSTRTLFAEASA